MSVFVPVTALWREIRALKWILNRCLKELELMKAGHSHKFMTDKQVAGFV